VKDQEKQREEVEERRTALSLKKKEAVSKQQAKAKMAEAEKSARQAHRRVMLKRLQDLSKKRKAGREGKGLT